MMNRVFAVLAYGAALLLGPSAQGHSAANDPPSVVVHYSDLDVTRAIGARKLLGRLWHAAHSVCGQAPDIRDLDRLARFHACTRASMDRAVADTHLPLVIALYAQPEWIAQNSADTAR